MAQVYKPGIAHERMAKGLCPECGEPAEKHLDDGRFWLPRNCDLKPLGVTERIEQYQEDELQWREEQAAHVGESVDIRGPSRFPDFI